MVFSVAAVVQEAEDLYFAEGRPFDPSELEDRILTALAHACDRACTEQMAGQNRAVRRAISADWRKKKEKVLRNFRIGMPQLARDGRSMVAELEQAFADAF